MRKILKFLGKTILAFVAFILLYLVTAFLLSRITVDEEPGTPDELAIYILTNGVHTDIVMPTRNEQMDWSKEIKYSNTIAADSSYGYVAMGWGDREFYMETPAWKDLKVSTALKAATGLGSAAIHATYYQRMEESESCKKLNISNEQYSRLITYINQSFQKDPDGHFTYIETNANYGNSDAFYEANGSLSMFATCNSWTNSALKASGQKACLWTAFDTGIFLKYK